MTKTPETTPHQMPQDALFWSRWCLDTRNGKKKDQAPSDGPTGQEKSGWPSNGPARRHRLSGPLLKGPEGWGLYLKKNDPPPPSLWGGSVFVKERKEGMKMQTITSRAGRKYELRTELRENDNLVYALYYGGICIIRTYAGADLGNAAARADALVEKWQLSVEEGN